MARKPLDTLSIGLAAAASLATFTIFMLAHAKAKAPELAALGEELGPNIAEDAVKAWITKRFGVTPEMFRRISARTTELRSFANLLS
jgi:hypothetical protein